MRSILQQPKLAEEGWLPPVEINFDWQRFKGQKLLAVLGQVRRHGEFHELADAFAVAG